MTTQAYIYKQNETLQVPTSAHSQVESAALLAAADYINGDGDGYLDDTAADNITSVLRKIAAELTRPQEVAAGVTRRQNDPFAFAGALDKSFYLVITLENVNEGKQWNATSNHSERIVVGQSDPLEAVRLALKDAAVGGAGGEVGAGKCYCDHHEHCSVCQPSLWLQKSITATPAAEQGDAKDASRYRRLRQDGAGDDLVVNGELLRGERLDAATDAILSSKPTAGEVKS